MNKRELILQLVQQKGPLLPSDITKETQENTIMLGAYLSDLVNNKQIFVTQAKIGGSPLYFTQAQRTKLFRLRAHLNDKDKELYDELEKKKVLVDKDLTPLQQAGVRKLKDFAIQLTITYNKEQFVVWKWHLTSNQQAVELLKEVFMPNAIQQTTINVEPPQNANVPVNSETLNTLKPTQSEAQQDTNTPNKEALQETIPETIQNDKQESPKESPPEKTSVLQNTPKPSESSKVTIQQRILQPEQESQQSIPLKETNIQDIADFLSQKGINLTDIQLITKAKEYECIATIKTQIGNLPYYCRIKRKAKCNEADIAVAYVSGIQKHLPILFVTTGTVTKKIIDTIYQKYPGLLVVELAWA
ncbi:MAG: hypothetical protein ACMXYC_02965 [Candidatus Woesearchaeota archaeon]